MQGLLVIFVSVGLGALIGGLTNYIAISMLFRPYSEHYLGRWKLPFTPGVIPKRQEEIAYQLGQLVEKQLVPVEKIRSKITSFTFQKELEEWLRGIGQEWLQSKQSLEQLLLKDKENMVSRIALEQAIHKLIQPVVAFLIQKLEDFLYSEEGEEFVYQAIQGMVVKQRIFGNMLAALLVKEKVMDKLRPIFLSALRNQATEVELQNQLYFTVHELLQREVGELLQPFEAELSQLLVKEVPRIVEWLDGQVPYWAKVMQVSELVREQVLSFPLPRLEELIRALAKRELRMITWFGALLGGLIGFGQALLVLLVFS